MNPEETEYKRLQEAFEAAQKREDELRERISKCYLKYEMINCPFCGAGSGKLFINHYRGTTFWISCETSDFGCGATGPECGSPEEACEAWNRRS